MDGSDACAREHGYWELGDHRHVDADRVAFLDPQRTQIVGDLDRKKSGIKRRSR
jgi:hypothetical protein